MSIILQQLQRQLRTQCLLKFTASTISRPQHLIHTTPKLDTFWERSKKAGYEKVHNISKKKLILDGLKELKKEINIWRQEVEESIKNDPILVWRPGETDVVFPFAVQEDIDKFVVTADSDHNEGFSKATFEISSAGHGLFHGQLDAKLAKDGKIKKTGYANIKSMRPRKSFKRETYLDWSQYNTLVMHIRGDGRSYLINVATEGYFDLTWNDVYHYVLYTRGGPHWQTVRIPFSKFFLSSKGRVQDRQFPIPLNRVSSLGFSVGARGGLDGPFQLEIDYIGLEFDPANQERFAYEMYKQQKYIVAT